MKTKSLRKPDVRVRSMVLAVAACFVTANSMALPVGPQVVNGTATISQVGNMLNVTNSNGAILNWQSFNIGANETTRFIQPSSSSAVLNRVLTQDPSVILGNLTSNGKVWLINPAGILVGPGARIDTAAFVASTLNITNADFLANRMRFEAGGGKVGNVVNQGTITTPLGGSVYLVGANVSNDGLITTPKGETILAAGNTVELLDSATPGVKVEITGAAGNATNLGEIVAEAGRVGIAGVIVRNSGMLNASSVVEEGGKIFLRASKDAYVDGAGRIVTTGKTGGQVEVLGERVAVMDQARIDASGEDAGGKILVGGDWQGKNPDVRNAQITYFGPEAELKVNATKVGAGGTAVVWADDTTRAYGRIEAKGVTRGGAVETSGKRYLDVDGARVEVGSGGAWLLDPADIRIVNSLFDAIDAYAYGSGIFSYGGALGTIRDYQINNALSSGGNVIVTTYGGYGGYGDITIYSGASINTSSGSSAATLSLYADRNIELQYGASIIGTATAPLSVAMEAYGGIALAGVIKTYGGDVALKARNGVAIGHSYYGYYGTSGIINARIDGAAANAATSYTGTAGRILINADTDGNGGLFKMYGGSVITTVSKAHLVDSTGNIGAYGSLAFGVVASDIDINTTEYGGAYIRLNQQQSGGGYGGGDIGFAPSTSGVVALGSYGGASFSLDNAELARILMPRAGAANCGTGQEGCRTWIGNPGMVVDSNFTVPATTSDFVLNEANFTSNDGTLTPKRIQLTTSGTVNDANVGVYGGYYGIKAGHLTVSAGGGIGTADSDGLSFFADSVNLVSLNGTIKATSVGGGDLALRRATAYGDININVLSGGVTLLPYFAGQREATYGSFSLAASGNIRTADYGSSYTVAGPLSTFTEAAPSAAAIRAGGSISLNSSGGSVMLGGDHAAVNGLSVFGYGGISLLDGGLASGTSLSLTTYGDLTLSGVSRSTIVKSAGAMTISARNLFAYGGNLINPAATLAFEGAAGQESLSGYGAGVVIGAQGTQNITVTEQIRLQAGSANHSTAYGSSIYGGSVEIRSNGTQTIAANRIELRAGASGHDNTAVIGSQGSQNIRITGSDGELLIQGGGDGSASVYGGAGSFNNYAEIANWSAATQTITTYGGGKITLRAGNGTGVLGGWYQYGGGYVSGQSGSNTAEISNHYNTGGGTTLDFYGGGTLALYGGGAGTGNSAELDAYSLTVTSSQGIAYRPDIFLQGGSAGGAGSILVNAKHQSRGNDAGIWSGDDNSVGGSATFNVRHLTIDGGTATYGGAGIGSYDLTINASGNVSLYGGSSSAIDTNETYGKATGAAYIGTDSDYGGGSIALNIGGNLYLKGGTGGSGPAIIGDLSNNPDITINTLGNIWIEAGAGSPAMIGSMGSGANIDIHSGGSITLTGADTNSEVMIGSFHDSASYGTSVSISAARDLTATGYVRLGVVTPSGNAVNTVELAAGHSSYYDGEPSGYGGNLNLGTTGPVVVNTGSYGGSVNILAFSDTAGAYGNVSMGSSSQIYGGYLWVNAMGDAYLRGNIQLPVTLATVASYGGSNALISAGGNVGIGTLTAYGAMIHAGKSILDENGQATNITANSIILNSSYGGAYGGLAISMDTASTGTISATVANNATYGGIFIRNRGSAPSNVVLYDSAQVQSAANFTQYGDLTVGAGGTAVTLTAHDVALQSKGNMTFGSGGLDLNAAYGGSILIGADGNISLGSGFNLFEDVDIAIVSGGNFTATNEAYLHAKNLGVVAGGLASVTYGAQVSAWDEVTVYGATGINFYGGYSYSDYSDIYLLTNGDIRLNAGTEIRAGNDAHLVLRGATSTLYLNETAAMPASQLVTDYATHDATTANINFTTRPSGGIVIDGAAYQRGAVGKVGGSGIFVASSNGLLVAEPGGGLSATNKGVSYALAAQPPVTPTVTQVTTATIATATETATNSLSNSSTTTPPPPPVSTGPATSGSGGLLLPSTGQTIGGSEGSFGSSASAASTTSTTSSSTSSTQTDSSGSSSSAKQESSQESKPAQKSEDKKEEKKDEKKDEKKKSEEKSEGKKDEKAASKKVSQCT